MEKYPVLEAAIDNAIAECNNAGTNKNFAAILDLLTQARTKAEQLDGETD